ncbi:MAG: hypothetical protein CMJ08_01535 [Pelagibacterales bacterium]|nr:hypothetical protein [Pelagibacterales bacterium]|tara:strand:+ start:1970 stop:3232 length:1263 start_codon:yes stop_codon:yes gene_type:complete
MNIAIIGSGPSAFYAAQSFSNNEKLKVDIIEKFFAPYGLVRYGVAPDHQKTKNIIKLFNRVLEKDNVNFFGNINVPKDISLDFLSENYDAVLIATGASDDKLLNIEGENIEGVYGSAEFVGWYNDNPEYSNLEPNLNSKNVIIIGNGNVALDCARILAKTNEELYGSDISKKNLKLLSKAKIDNIYVIGRRGPKEAKFTISELREFKEINDFSIKLKYPRELLKKFIDDETIDTRVKKNLEVFDEFYDNEKKSKEIVFDFFKSPIEIIGNQKVEGIKLKDQNGDTHNIQTNLIIKAIGYKATSIGNLKMDETNNYLFNIEGHINNNIFTTGWASSPSVGVIGTNKGRALNAVNKILSLVSHSKKNSTEKLKEKMKNNKIVFITKDDWNTLDKLEEDNAMKHFVREKFNDINIALDVLKRN